MHLTRKVALLSLLSLPVGLLASSGVAVAAKATGARTSTVTTSSLGHFAPTFTGSAATGCATNCSLLTGPFNTASTAAIAAAHHAATGAKLPAPHAMPAPYPRRPAITGHLKPNTSFPIPSVSCPGPGCSNVSTAAGGATGVKGLNAVDSASLVTNPQGDIEPPDQGLCAGNGSVVETNNIGEILVFNTALGRVSAPIPLDTLMGLTGRGWSSGGDPSCVFDPANGGHWIFTEIASASPESAGGPFAGCFAAVSNTCYEGIAVTDGSSPFGPYHVYFANANYNPAEPGYPNLLNDFAKISVTRDAFLLFYDEFPLFGGGFGGGFFNGAQEFAFNKNALENGLPVTDPSFTVASENMGLLKTPDGTCASDNALHTGGITCWVAAIPAQPVAGLYDNSHGGTGFMLGSLDFYSFAGLTTSGDNRIAAWAWTHLSNLNSAGCATCGKIRFSGQLFSGVNQYYDTGTFAAQKAGNIPLGDQCGAAGLSALTSCAEGGLATNGDNLFQVSQAQGQLWAATNTQIAQTYSGGINGEIHQGAVYWVVGTKSFDKTGWFGLTNQGYVSAAHEDLTMPAVAATPDAGGKAIIFFTLAGNGGPTGADHGGFFPSAAFGRLTSSSHGLLGSKINIANAGQSPQDGFTEYQGQPGPTRPRWGDYTWGMFVPGTGGRIYFANEYIQFPNCTGSSFTLTIGTCGGTRDGFANWGTSVSYVVP